MKKEELTINVRITGVNEVKGHVGTARMILFDGDVDCDNFKGKILPGGVDTQKEIPGETFKLSARYVLEGTDFEGKECHIFIENNGELGEDGSLHTVPKVFTDSEALSYLENKDLFGTIEDIEGGVRIHIFSEG
ncbi:DUF3237 family protein [Butyrivibrio sp. VCD2006]|uniref:DUF3237 family protein n=1 Tax=Butyrivibrio sp. VCD2006 TaxID=1280664 RepID=UPI00040C1076|nr:DUF3237 family protein [Butyrivibrio sp. VCD2006]